MRILGPIIEMATDLLAVDISNVFHGSAVGSQAIRHDRARCPVALHRFSQELKCCRFVSSFGDVAFQNFAFMIDRSPKVVGHTINLHVDLIDMPTPLRDLTKSLRSPLPDLAGKHRSEPVPPIPNCLVADFNAALVKEILNVSKRERETDIHHHREADYLR